MIPMLTADRIASDILLALSFLKRFFLWYLIVSTDKKSSFAILSTVSPRLDSIRISFSWLVSLTIFCAFHLFREMSYSKNFFSFVFLIIIFPALLFEDRETRHKAIQIFPFVSKISGASL